MYGYTGAGAGGGDAGYTAQHGYGTRSRGRGRQETQEERYVEGDLFGSTKRASFRSSDPPAGKPSRTPYYDGEINGLRNAGGGAAVGAGYGQQPHAARPSPFARQPLDDDNFSAPMVAPGAGYGGRGYAVGNSNAPGGMGDYTPAGAWSGVAGGGSEVALVPIDPTGSHASNAMEDDEDIPTRSLADIDSGDNGGLNDTGGLRHRRGDDSNRLGGGASASAGFGRQAEPDAQRDTWVVVWGVPPGKSNDVLSRFLQFGHVEQQRGVPDSNWLYLKYATRLQAEKALAAGHGSRLTETVMLGVQKVADDEVWHSLREGRIPPLATAQPVLSRNATGRFASSQRTPTNERLDGGGRGVDDEDLLGAPPQRPRGEASVCGKIRAFFGFY